MRKQNLAAICLVLITIMTATLTGCNGGKSDKDKELSELRQLAEMDRREMENQYAEFAAQYGEMKKNIKDDSLVAKLDAEQRRAEDLLRQLRELKTNSSAEILRLRKELETVRAVLRDYIRQVDSLQQVNIALTNERDLARADAERTRMENSSINAQNSRLSEKVAVAAQLNATGVSVTPLKKNGKAAKKTKDITRFMVSFTITRNVTASAGNRTVYVRLLKPTQDVVGSGGSFHYENKTIQCSAARTIEYTGEEQRVTVYVPVNEFISAGRFSAFIFADGQMIGSGSVQMSR